MKEEKRKREISIRKPEEKSHQKELGIDDTVY
jgi:hypothetical protein